jgi:putative oxidoreductase
MNDSVSRFAKLGMLPLMNDAGSRFAKWGMLPLRIVVGLVFLMHGAQKLFVFGLAGTADIMGKLELPLPVMCAAVVITVELLGGLAILLGVFARLAGALLAFEMVVAILVARLHGGFFAPYGYEFELTLLGACLTFALSGPGRISFEDIWRRSSTV